MNMIERVAKAINPRHGTRNLTDFTTAFYEELEAHTLGKARAAIEAMRPDNDDTIDKFIVCQFIDAALSPNTAEEK